MIVYKEKISSLKSKSELDRLLKEKLVSREDQSKIYLFPFCLFSKDFLNDFKRSLTLMFSGELRDRDFNLRTDSIVFSTRRNLPLIITGSIEGKGVNLTYSIPVYVILLMGVFSLIIYFFGRVYADFEGISMVILGLFIFMYLVKLMRIHFVFKRICS